MAVNDWAVPNSLLLDDHDLVEMRSIATTRGYGNELQVFIEPKKLTAYGYLLWIEGISARGIPNGVLPEFTPLEAFGFERRITYRSPYEEHRSPSIPDVQFLENYANKDYDSATLGNFPREKADLFIQYMQTIALYEHGIAQVGTLGPLIIERDALRTQLKRCSDRLYADGYITGPLRGIARVLKVWLAEIWLSTEALDKKGYEEALAYAEELWKWMCMGGMQAAWLSSESLGFLDKLESFGSTRALAKVTAAGLIHFLDIRDVVLEEAVGLRHRWLAAEHVLHRALMGLPFTDDWIEDARKEGGYYYELLEDFKGSWRMFTPIIMRLCKQLRFLAGRKQSFDKIAEKINADLRSSKHLRELIDENNLTNDFSRTQLIRVRDFAKENGYGTCD